MRTPSVLYVEDLIADSRVNAIALPNGHYVAERPAPWRCWTMRWRAAWLVWSGRADAVLWEGQ